jgi:hypothetical protein
MPMKLLTKELEKQFEKVGRQERVADPLVIAKFFNPCGSGTWCATEYDSQDRLFYGFVSLFGDECDEWGYFCLDELSTTQCPIKINGRQIGFMNIERDLYFKPLTPISKVCPKAVRN